MGVAGLGSLPAPPGRIVVLPVLGPAPGISPQAGPVTFIGRCGAGRVVVWKFKGSSDSKERAKRDQREDGPLAASVEAGAGILGSKVLVATVADVTRFPRSSLARWADRPAPPDDDHQQRTDPKNSRLVSPDRSRRWRLGPTWRRNRRLEDSTSDRGRVGLGWSDDRRWS